MNKMLNHIIITTLNKAFINPISCSPIQSESAGKKYDEKKKTTRKKIGVASEKKIATWKLYVSILLTFQTSHPPLKVTVDTAWASASVLDKNKLMKKQQRKPRTEWNASNA